MSWLYSIVFAGLLFSSNNDTAFSKAEIEIRQAPGLEVIAALTDETEKFEQTYQITANGRVSVSNVNGSIVVEAWDRNEVRLEATKIADTREALADVEIKVDSRADAFRVEADYSGLRRDRDKGWKNHRKLEVQFRLSVPRTAVLDQIGTVNGSVSVSNMTNVTKVSAVNGEVRATNLRGMASLETVNGTVEADFDRLDAGSKISLQTVNGRVNLVIPSDANATIKADSLNGSIINDFGLPVRKGKYVGRDMYGRVGSGDVQIRLESVNGGLSVSRRNDGRTPNPATDLLPAKGKADEDWDDDDVNDTSFNIKNLNKEISGAVKKSEKDTAAAMKDAQKELENIQPLIDKEALNALMGMKVEIDGAQIEKNIKNGLAGQTETLARLSGAMFAAGAPLIEKKTNSFPVKGIPKVVIEAKGCAVKVRGWDKPEVKYVLTSLSGVRGRTDLEVEEVITESGVSLRVVKKNKHAPKGDASSNVVEVAKPEGVDRIVISPKAAVVTKNDGGIEKYDLTSPEEKKAFERKHGGFSPSKLPSAPRSGSRSSSASASPSQSPLFSPNYRWDFEMFNNPSRFRIEVYVPTKSDLKIITDREIRLDGVSGDIELTGEDEAINIRDVDGKLSIAAAEGQVRVIGFKGEFDSITTEGDLYLEGDFEKISTKATCGTVTLTLPENTNASFTSNTEIESDGVNVSRENDRTWRLGTGGAKFNFNFTDGKLIIRNAALVNSY
ncbi:MAG: DUF4097 family beta strand repeat protein [Blastocatellia bacterium]|nr:DUF4097 family beta strand repeat protein [Blastocatellia bacterium]